MGRMDDKLVVITGGTTGIGFASAQRFVAEGARVVITGRNAERLSEASAALGERVEAQLADVRQVAALERLAKEIAERHGRVDVLFANAGSGVFAPIEAVTEADFDQQFEVNVRGVFFTVQKLLPLMDTGGSIILTASAVTGKGVGTGSLYFATKAAVRSLARTLAAELGERGIRVNALSPGITRTHFSKAVNVSESEFEGFMQMVASQAPLAREGTAEEMADAALFLASQESAYMTAAELVVDGGWMNV